MATIEELYRAKRGMKRLRPGFELEGESIPTDTGDVYSAWGGGGSAEPAPKPPESDADLLEPLQPIDAPRQDVEYRPEALGVRPDGPDPEPDNDPDDAGHLAALATASAPKGQNPTADESWGQWLRAKAGRGGGGLAAAQQVDRESALANMLQRAGRQVIAGLTRTPEAETIGSPVDAERNYLAAQQLRRENALKALKDKREGRMSDAEIDLKRAEAEKARRLPVAPAARPPKDDSLDRDRLALDREKWEWAKTHPHVAAPKPPKEAKPGTTGDSLSMPFDTGSFEPREGTSLDRESLRKVREHASLYNSALGGLDDYTAALKRFAEHPSPETRSEVMAKVGTAAAHMNTAAGQGAMADAEYKRQLSDLGAPGATADTVGAIIDKVMGDDPAAAKALLRRAQSVRSTVRAAATARLKPYNYEFRDGAATTPPVASSGVVVSVVRASDGKTIQVPADRVDGMRKKGLVK